MRAMNNQVVLKPREDLEDNYGDLIRVNTVTGLIEPRPVYGQVVSVGRGDQMHPDLPDLKPGDLVVWDLSKIGPPVIEHGETIILVSFNALLGKIHNPKTDEEDYQALMDYVLTERAPLASKRAMSRLIEIPDNVLADGVGERGKDNLVSTVFERVVSTGKGLRFPGRSLCARCKDELCRLEEPDCKPGDLVAFNPAWSIEWRRRGRNFRWTPGSEIRGQVEE